MAVGAFTPFFSVYFATRAHLSVERIGAVFSGRQLASVLVVLAAPIVLRRLGPVTGIAAMQLATGISLASLALATSAATAALAYAAYMSFRNERARYSQHAHESGQTVREAALRRCGSSHTPRAVGSRLCSQAPQSRGLATPRRCSRPLRWRS